MQIHDNSPDLPFFQVLCPRHSRWSWRVVLLIILGTGLLSLSLYSQDRNSSGGAVPGLSENSGFPFVPRDMDAEGPVSAAFLNDHKAGSLGRLKAGPEGHLWLGDRRVRFLGLNCTWIPGKDAAPELARRLSALGINIIRFHHMDAPWGGTLLSSRIGKSAEPDPVMMDRLDFFIARLEEQGIYINLNLLTGRQFTLADGLNPEVEGIKDFKTRHSIGFWDKKIQDLQKDWARKYLGHANPYTGMTYLEDPAVAIVEINNENGLLQTWMGNQLDDIPEVFTRSLQSDWNAWLRKKYSNDAKLRKVLNLSEALGDEILAPLTREGRPGNWNLEQHGTAKALVSALSGMDGVRLEVSRASAEPWHVQYNLAGLKLTTGQIYTLAFKARKASAASAQDRLDVGIAMAHAPWEGLGFGRTVVLGTEWQQFTIPIASLTMPETNARINFGGLGTRTGGVEIADVSLRTGGSLIADSASIDSGKFPLPPARQREGLQSGLLSDWLAFLWEKEDAYWAMMQDWLRKDLGVRSLIAGTIVGCSPPSIQARFDLIDTHAYWNHPSFPGTAWDPFNNYITNLSLTRDPAGGTLTQLAQARIKGKPFSVSEYDHPWPNQFAAEMYPLLASFAAFQDWDMLYGFTMEPENPGGPVRIAGFFDQLSNPLKASALPFAARIFRQGLVSPGKTLVALRSGVQAERESMSVTGAWNIPDFRKLGIDRSLALRFRMALSLDPADSVRSMNDLTAANQAILAALPGGRAGEFEGGELSWDPRLGEFMVRAPEVLAGIHAGEPGVAGSVNPGAGEDDQVGFVLSNPLWGLELRNVQNFAALMVVPAGPAGWHAPRSEKQVPAGAASGSLPGVPDKLLLWTARAGGNTREILVEYAGPRKRPGKPAPDPFALARVGPVWNEPSSTAWALGATWDSVSQQGWMALPLDLHGLVKALSGPVSGQADPSSTTRQTGKTHTPTSPGAPPSSGQVTTDGSGLPPRSLIDPVDRTLWYELIRP